MILHPPHAVHSARHLPSWALLAFAAGAVNVGALLAVERFVSHVTGTVARLGAEGSLLAIDGIAVLLSFVAGATAAVALVRVRERDGRPGPYWLPLAVVAAVIAAVGLAGRAGLFGPFGGEVDTTHDFVLLCVLGFAMGAQNAVVAASTGSAVRTTHLTGPVTDIAIAFATLLVGREDERPAARQSIVLRGTKLVAFLVGALVMAVLVPRIAWLAFLVPAFACAIAIVSSFLPEHAEPTALRGESG